MKDALALDAPGVCKHCGADIDPARWWREPPEGEPTHLVVEYRHCGDQWTVSLVLKEKHVPTDSE